MDPEVDQLVDAFLSEAHDEALRGCRRDPVVAGIVARRIGAALWQDSIDHWTVSPRERTWVNHQQAVLHLAALDGVDQADLAHAMAEAVAWQRIDGDSPLDSETFDWMIEWAPQAVVDIATDSARGEPPRSTGARFLAAGLWTHRSDRARGWMMDLVRANPYVLSGVLQNMYMGRIQAPWPADEWTTRLHLFADERIETIRWPTFTFPADMRSTLPAQCRFALVYSRDPADSVVRTIAKHVKAHRSGDPADDVGLFWWQADESQWETLRQLIEISGSPEQRGPLVAEAARSGLIEPDLAEFLGAAVPRPKWADGEVPWEVESLETAGELVLPEGVVAGGDLFLSAEGVAWTFDVAPGRYDVRVVVAIHPLARRECAAAEVLLAPSVEPVCWDVLPPRIGSPDREGYLSEFGIVAFGAAEALPRWQGDDPNGDNPLSSYKAAFGQIDAGDLGTVVAFTVGPQHQDCRSWVGRGPSGAPVRILTDLGLLGLDPVADPDLPW